MFRGLALTLCLAAAAPVLAQTAAAPVAAHGAAAPTRTQHAAAAEDYLQRYSEIMALEAAPDGVADVANLVIQRDVGRSTLAAGKLYLLGAVGGRKIGAVFHGTGSFSFAPPSKVEQNRLVRFEKKNPLEVPLLDVVLLFADTTLDHLERRPSASVPRPPSPRCASGPATPSSSWATTTARRSTCRI